MDSAPGCEDAIVAQRIPNGMNKAAPLSALIVTFLLFTRIVYGQAAAPARNIEGLDAILWSQRSAEFKSICLQTFVSAKSSLTRALKDRGWTAALEQKAKFGKLPPAVILDLDETVLDNTSFRVRMMEDSVPYSEARWQQWVDKEQAPALPGAVDFLQFAQSQGVAAFYITNRLCDSSAATDHTVALLRGLKFPLTPAQLVCRTSLNQTTNKSGRRAAIASTHRVLLLLGDDLNDFVTVPEIEGDWKAKLELRDGLVQANREAWGTKWFILPNPVYGSWERAFGNSVKSKTDALRR